MAPVPANVACGRRSALATVVERHERAIEQAGSSWVATSSRLYILYQDYWGMVTTITLAKTNCSRQGLCRSVTLTCGPVQAEWFGGAIWFALWGPFLEISMIAQITPLLVIPMQGLFGNCLEEALSWVYGAFPPCFLESVHSAAASTPHMCRDMRIIFRRPSCYAKGSEGPQQNQGGLCILCWCRPICAPIMREHMLCSMQNEHMRLAEEDMKQEPNNDSSRYMKSTPMALKPRGGVYVLVCRCASPRSQRWQANATGLQLCL